MAQFRVEFVLDEATGMYIAEFYHPENENEVVVRTEALYPTQAAAVLGVLQIFKDAILQFPEPKKAVRKKKKPARKKPVRRKAAKRRKHR